MKSLPKVELHVHLEFTATPHLIKRLATRHQIKLPEHVFTDEETFRWRDFFEFLKIHDIVTNVIQTPEDYRDITYEYLIQSAEQGVIYTELLSSPDHAALVGMSYQNHLEGIVQGIQDARDACGIEARIIIGGVRQFGEEKVNAVAECALRYPNPYVVGFGLGGDELNFPGHLFKRAYEIAHDAGLGGTVHAGEICGAESVKDAIDHLKITRIGHGVRSIEDKAIMQELKERNIHLEVCPTSNIALNVFPNLESHPLRKLFDYGISLSLNSDDPPYFNATMEQEYQIARDHFGFSESELLMISQQAIDASFADVITKEKLKEKLKNV